MAQKKLLFRPRARADGIRADSGTSSDGESRTLARARAVARPLDLDNLAAELVYTGSEIASASDNGSGGVVVHSARAPAGARRQLTLMWVGRRASGDVKRDVNDRHAGPSAAGASATKASPKRSVMPVGPRTMASRVA